MMKTKILNICLPALAICFPTFNASAYETKGKEMGRQVDQQETGFKIEQKVHDTHVKAAEHAKEKAEAEAYNLKVKSREAAVQARSATQHIKEVAERSDRVAEQKVHDFTEKAWEEASHAKEIAKRDAVKAEQKALELSKKAEEAEARAQDAARHVDEVSRIKIITD